MITGTRFVKLRNFDIKIYDEIFKIPVKKNILLLFRYNKLVSKAVDWKLNCYFLSYWGLQFIYTGLVYFFPDVIYPLMQILKVIAYVLYISYILYIYLIIKRTVFNLFLQLNGNPNFLRHACESLYNSCLIIMHNIKNSFVTHIINCARSASVYAFTFPVKRAQIYLLGTDTYFDSYGKPSHCFHYIKNYCVPNYRHKIFLLGHSNRKKNWLFIEGFKSLNPTWRNKIWDMKFRIFSMMNYFGSLDYLRSFWEIRSLMYNIENIATEISVLPLARFNIKGANKSFVKIKFLI